MFLKPLLTRELIMSSIKLFGAFSSGRQRERARERELLIRKVDIFVEKQSVAVNS